LACAARAMRSALVDHARRSRALKRDGLWKRVPLDDALRASFADSPDILEVDRALDRLRATDERLADIVDLRFFGGLSELNIAAALHISERTVRREWRLAKAWLERELSRKEEDGGLGENQTRIS